MGKPIGLVGEFDIVHDRHLNRLHSAALQWATRQEAPPRRVRLVVLVYSHQNLPPGSISGGGSHQPRVL